MTSDCSREQLIQELTEARAQLAAKENRCQELSKKLTLLKAKKLPEHEHLVRSAGGKPTKQAEAALRESEAKYRNLFENMTEEVHFWKVVRDEAGRITTWRLVDVNPPTLKTWGRSSADEIRGKTTDEIFGPGATDHYMPVVQKIMTEGVAYSFEDYFPNLDKYFRFTSVPLGDYFITTGADITDIKKAYEASRESEERWAVTLSSIGDAVIASDTNGRVSFMNPVAEKLTGWSLAEAAGKPVQEVFRIVNEHTRAVVDNPVSKVLQTGLVVGLANHTVLLRKGGGEIPIDDSGAPISDAEGRVFGVVLIFRDITERKQAEEALSAAEEIARQRLMEIEDLYRNAPVGLCVLDRNLRWVRINERLAEINGIPAEAHIGKRVRDLMPELAETVEPEMRRVLETGKPRLNIEIVSETPAQPGIKRNWLEQWLPLTDADGRVTGLSIVVEEITDRKRAEERLRKTTEDLDKRTRELNAILSSVQDYLYIFDPEGRFVFANQKLLDLWGLSAEKAVGKTMRDLNYPETVEELLLQGVQRVCQTGEVVSNVTHYISPMGVEGFYENILSPMRGPNGQVAFIAGSSRDITKSKQAEEALRQSREDLDRAQAVGQVGWWRLDTRKNVLTWSDENHRIFGVPKGTPLTYGAFLAAVHPDDRQYVDTQWQACLRGEPYDIEHRIVVGGQVKWVREKAFLEFDKEGTLLGGFGIAQDITARKEAQAAVDRMRVMLAEGQKIAHVGSWEYLADTQTTVWSDEQCRIYGIDPAAGSPPYDVMLAKHIHPDDAVALHEAFSAALRDLAVYEQEHRIVRPDGSVRVLFERALPYLDENGKLVKYMGASLDITERTRAEEELRQLNLSLEQRVSERTTELAHTVEVLQEEISQRVRAENELKLANEQLAQRADQLRRLAGELTAIEQTERKRLSRILHDGLQQHLASAKIQLGGLAEQIENEDLKRTADEIERIIGEGLSMSRSLNAELSPPILHEGGLSEGLEWLIRWMREKHRISVDLSLGAVPELREDVKILVFESVRELLFNALKHAQVSRAQVRLDLVGNGEMRVTVSDEGAGFDSCRLLPAGDGGGFGLFSIRERVGLLGGRLEIDSAPGRGSRVALTVPHGQADAARFLMDDVCAPALLPPRGAAKDQETTISVLLVDDHALFRNGIARLLKNEPGFEVVGEAKDGQEAIEFAQKHMPNVILMDISMPGVNGIEATQVIHERHPEVCIIGLSMYDDPEKERAMRAAGATDYRTKGCTRAELVAAIRAVLKTRKPSSKLKLHTNNQVV